MVPFLALVIMLVLLKVNLSSHRASLKAAGSVLTPSDSILVPLPVYSTSPVTPDPAPDPSLPFFSPFPSKTQPRLCATLPLVDLWPPLAFQGSDLVFPHAS